MNLPTQFGPYLLLERISVGGMAEVYKAKEYGVEGFERTVAVKRILPHVAEDEEFIAMFKDEAKIAVQLNHGNIAQIYNLGNEQDSFYIALEYVNGRDLRAIFQKCQQAGRAMPVPQACYIIMKICEGLDYAHNKKDKYNRPLNIVHRDVSPPNILTSFEGEVKLIDFGVAKAAGRASRTQAGILKGKFGYMSPEQVRGMPLDRRSDVFSVGVVLFEILTSQRLFQADTDFATLEKVRAVEVPRPSSLNPEIPKPLENIIYKALAREPEQRYQSAIELHDELQAFMFAQGMFYSRKDLAAWMRENYAREIELEKEKAQTSVPPPAPNGKRRSTMMMPPGGGRPPPPPPGRSAAPPAPPPPPPRPAAGLPSRTPPAEAAGAAGRKPKRKTMVMTTARPNLPPPPGQAPPKPRPPAPRERDLDPPTIPVSSALPRAPSSSPPLPRPRPKATQSYAAASASAQGAAAAAPPAHDFDWDDDELETRLFEDAKEDKPDVLASGGANRLTVGGETNLDDGEPPTRVDVQGVHRGSPSVTVAPDVGATSVPSDPMAKGLTVVPGMMTAQPVPFPPAPSPAQQQQMHGMHGAPMGQPTAPQQQMHPQPHMSAPGMSAPGMMQQGYGAPSAAMSGAGMAAPAMSMPGGPMAMGPGMAPGMGMGMPMDFDDRPPKSNTGLVVVIVVALLVLFGAGAGGFWLISKNRDNASSGEVAKAEGGEAKSASADGGAAAEGNGALTVEPTPADAIVTVDGAGVDGPAPFIRTVSAGRHMVKVEHPDYLPIEKAVDVPAGGLRLPVKLQHKNIALVVQVEPREASVNLLAAGKAIGTAQAGAKLEFARQDAITKYEVEASARGYVSQRVELAFTGEQNETVELKLSRDSTVAIGPTGPAVSADPPPVETPTPRTQPRSKSKSKSGSSSKSTPTPTSTPPPTPKSGTKSATLRIGTKRGVKPAKVFVDGKAIGDTPIGAYKVTAGKHTVEWRWEDGKKVTETITIEEDGVQTLKRG